MYKHLFIARHGSSPGSRNGISDIDRILNEQGIIDCHVMSIQLSNNGNLPDKILSSPAIRAFHSATIFARTFNYIVNDIIINDEIYLADKNIMLNIIKQTDDKVQGLMVFGHNSTFTDLSNHFLKDEISNMPPSGIVGLKFKVESWSKIDRKNVVDSFFDHP